MSETKIIETPTDKHKIEIKLWLTGRERRVIRNVFLNAMKFEIGGDAQSNITKLSNDSTPSDILIKAENIAIETIIVSINGSKDNILDTVLDMKESDYNFIVKEINTIAQEVNFPKS